MTTESKKLQSLADDILRALDRLDGDTPQVEAVRGHVLALAQLLGVRGAPEILGHEAAERARDEAITDERRVRGFKMSTTPPRRHDTQRPPPGSIYPQSPHEVQPEPPRGARPGLGTERRIQRMLAGVTLKQAAAAAGTSYTTTRMYESKRSSVRPDKRAALDQVYMQFKKDPTK